MNTDWQRHRHLERCYPPKQKTETLQNLSQVCCCLRLALTSTISLARTIQMAHLTSWSPGTWEAYSMEVIVPSTLRLCRGITNKKKEEIDNKGLQIWWGGEKNHYQNTRHRINTILKLLPSGAASKSSHNYLRRTISKLAGFKHSLPHPALCFAPI